MPAIDTAPKDGTWFLGWNGFWHVAAWLANAREGGSAALLSEKMEPFHPPLTDWIPLPPKPGESWAEEIARVCHEVNRAFCAAFGDLSQPAWADAPDWQRGSAINGVHFAFEHPDAKPSDSHESWLAEKRADGWTWGPVKDPALKQHPCFVPYDELPTEQRAKDYIFLAVVRALAA